MNALDIAARGLARRALNSFDQAAEGSVNICARTEPSAAALEALAAEHALLTGYAGATHTVEFPPYLTGDNLVLRGNGAELRNTSTRDISDSDIVSVALPLGSSNATATGNLTFYEIAVATSAGPLLDLGANAASFAEGDLVVLHGATSYPIVVEGTTQYVYRHYLRARVLATSGNFITLDRAPSAELYDDGPAIGNTAQGVDCGFGDGPDASYLLYGPNVSNITLSSQVGDAWKWGGVIDGRFRDVTVRGRGALVFNALQDCLFDGVRFTAWRKIAEMAEGSVGSVYRNVRGSLLSNAGKFGGNDDVPPFFIGFTENCRDCLMDDFIVSSGPNGATAEAVVIGSGINNAIRNSRLYFPAHDGLGVLFSSSGVAGHGQSDCGIDNCEISLPRCTTYLAMFPGAAGMTGPFVRDTQFAGEPVSGIAAQIGYPGTALSGAVLDNVRFEKGALNFNGAVTDCTVRHCYIPGGFANLTNALLKANRIHDNDSDANKAARAGAYIEQGLNQTTASAANTIYAKADFPAGSLAAGDRVSIVVDAASGDAQAKTARLTATHGSAPTTTVLGANVRGSANAMYIRAEIQIVSDTAIAFRADLWGSIVESFAAVGSIASYGLEINLELWTANAASPIGVRCVRIIPVKPGMMHLPLI